MKCSNIHLGSMIGRYEFGLLNNKEKQLFNRHLLECDACYQDFYEFRPVQDVLQQNRKQFGGILHRATLIENVKRFLSSSPLRIAQLFRINQPVLKYSIAMISIGIFLIALISALRKDAFHLRQEDFITLHGYQTEVVETTGYQIYSDTAIDKTQSKQATEINIQITDDNQTVSFQWSKDPYIYSYDIEVFKSGDTLPLFAFPGIQEPFLTVPVDRFDTKVIYQFMLTGKGQNDKYFRVKKDFKLE